MSYVIPAALVVVGALLLMFVGGQILLEETRRLGEGRRLSHRLGEFGRHDALLDEEQSPEGGVLEAIGRATTRSQSTIAEFEQMMRSIGRYDANAPYWLAGLRLVAGVVLMLAGLAVGYAFYTPRIALLSALAGFAIGYLVPRYYLSTLANARRLRVEKELPFLIDMLLLLVRSGASIEQAFRHLGHEEADGLDTLKESIERLVIDIDQGKGYEISLQRWGARLAVDEGRELAALLIQSMTHGTELTAALKVFSETMIERRMNAARTTIGKRMTQLTVIMMLFMMPPLIIIIAGPAVSRLIEGFSSLHG
ncbi:type II secretion system F family protein [Oleomonas cavernae]|uniref:Type II secretion system F family protein n=1 Tax=Oleomonas cavernae TaxID=2320859 RepID=A0A418WFE4_9PROT|nr:type II secretion system F family protein [Oleomonas cavernae]RJF88741.1 type II secretion system F family protein [Oleomonas cavernae]